MTIIDLRSRPRRTIAIGIAVGLLFGAGPCGGQDLVRYQQTQIHMGMSFGIVLYAADEMTANRAFTAAFARIAALNRVFSDYDAESELSRLCAQAPTSQPVPVSAELAAVLDYAQRLSRRTGGAFDVTIGPLSKLWRRARRTYQLPSPERIERELAAVGYEALRVDGPRRTVELLKPHMRIDLGAIAPGYAADEAIRVLAGFGLTRTLVNASGDITVADPPPGESGWQIGIAPLTPDGAPSRSVVVSHAAVSTSGDAFQFLEVAGKRYSHIIDPRTGYGLAQRSSVTVIAPTGLQADTLATAASVLGPEKGLDFIEQTPGAAALFVTIQDDRPEVFASSRFADFTAVSAGIP